MVMSAIVGRFLKRRKEQAFRLMKVGGQEECLWKADRILDQRNGYGSSQRNHPFHYQAITGAQKGDLTMIMAKEKSDNITTKYNASLWISVLYQWEKMRKKLEERENQTLILIWCLMDLYYF